MFLHQPAQMSRTSKHLPKNQRLYYKMSCLIFTRCLTEPIAFKIFPLHSPPMSLNKKALSKRLRLFILCRLHVGRRRYDNLFHNFYATASAALPTVTLPMTSSS